MILEPDEAELFDRAWWPLLEWVNKRRKVVPTFARDQPAIVNKVRKVLWSDDRLIDAYVKGPVGDAERALITSWKRRTSDIYMVFKHMKKHSIFMTKKVYAVLGIHTPIAEFLPTLPTLVGAVLLPFGDRIIIDGLLESTDLQIKFGYGARGMLQQQYREAIRANKLVTSLPRRR
jgi:hypothetical protein